MFVRKKVLKSNKTCVQVVSKTRDYHQKVLKTLGSSSDPKEIEKFIAEGQAYIDAQEGLLIPGFDEEEDAIDKFAANLINNQIQVIGPELIFGTLYDKIGYNAVDSAMFRHLVICRLFNPGSKLKTVDYLERYLHEKHSVSSVYKFLDELCYRDSKNPQSFKDYKSQIQDITFNYTKKVVGGEITVCFYDMTTLYFEAAEEDELRICGFSKDGKHDCPQIYLGLLVASGGNPIGYEIFEGNKAEVLTLIPMIQALSAKYNLGNPTIVADAGLLSKSNIANLTALGYKYIIGARPKNETEEIKAKILGFEMKDDDIREIQKNDGSRLILSKTEKRRVKDYRDRQRGLSRLQKRVKNGKLTKKDINNRGYNKYLKMEGEMTVSIDMERFEKDAAWDGIKGYVTNADLAPKTIISNYASLAAIERCFRFNKFDLAMRPIYHRLRNRIDGHICICFTAYTILMELERLLKAAGVNMSIHRAQELTKNMYALNYTHPKSMLTKHILLRMVPEQQILYDVIEKDKANY